MFRVKQTVVVGGMPLVRGATLSPGARLTEDECMAYCEAGVFELVDTPPAEPERGDASAVVLEDFGWDRQDD